VIQIHERGANLGFPEEELTLAMSLPHLTRWHRFKIWIIKMWLKLTWWWN